MARQTLDDPFYYLVNFQTVLAWLDERYADLLAADERGFIDAFGELPRAAQALLVRMIMRKGGLFRRSRLDYPEIAAEIPPVQAQAQADEAEPLGPALAPLIAVGWVDPAPALTLEELFALLTKAELQGLFAERLAGLGLRQASKRDWLAVLGEVDEPPRTLAEWGHDAEVVLALRVDALCERLRLMFFGNLHQGWSEFVLADLGMARYERVAFSRESRAFASRDDLEDYLHLHRCRERLADDEPVSAIDADVPREAHANPWLEARRAKLLFRLAQHSERQGALDAAHDLYARCTYAGARGRRLRMLERLERFDEALKLAREAERSPESEAERQQLARVLPRLHRRLGLPRPASVAPAEIERLDLELPFAGLSVERTVQAHLGTPEAPAHYVENTLIGGLFGLLCWEAIFAPLPGAFFNPFQRGPADLAQSDFHARRRALFDGCLASLESDAYQEIIRRAHADKRGIQSPFVSWECLPETLLEQALACLPAAHLRLCFERLLADIPANRAGLPDLIQLWPEEGRYKMIEVKGPGDRLQDNQRRWLSFFKRHAMPVSVCHVRWAEAAGEARRA
ncbi:VRR-NUC domain-containing protein [Halomonas sp. HP20-15]|uniref:VRR-NUC domain-containing protein n=1 Tax=Halomonas sp. HP20-15 TaxID=3085901 RepID=UPI00298206DC|nr:VRR-NUC domain-containing protein [Halomonas sp. HP20-15]MDW5377343.1 VRR-NUC domain-containing protein [Halomonas sp. HP20-15]